MKTCREVAEGILLYGFGIGWENNPKAQMLIGRLTETIEEDRQEQREACAEAVAKDRFGTYAAGPWETEKPAPKDGTRILAMFGDCPMVILWEIWETRDPPPNNWGGGWCISGNRAVVIHDEPDKWAPINLPPGRSDLPEECPYD